MVWCILTLDILQSLMFKTLKSFIFFLPDVCGDCEKIWKAGRVSIQQTEKSLSIFAQKPCEKIRHFSHDEPVSFLISFSFIWEGRVRFIFEKFKNFNV